METSRVILFDRCHFSLYTRPYVRPEPDWCAIEKGVGCEMTGVGWQGDGVGVWLVEHVGLVLSCVGHSYRCLAHFMCCFEYRALPAGLRFCDAI